MTLRSLEDILPNGFHDAEIGAIDIDFLGRTATLKLRILTSLPATEKETGVLYRPITVLLSGLLAIHLNSGHVKNFEQTKGCWLQVQGFEPTVDELASLPSMRDVPIETTYGFFVHDWNECIYMAANGATLVFE